MITDYVNRGPCGGSGLFFALFPKTTKILPYIGLPKIIKSRNNMIKLNAAPRMVLWDSFEEGSLMRKD